MNRLKTADIFQNGMVFQRNKPVRIWGTGNPGEEIRVSIQGKSADTVIRPDGTWMAVIPELEASEEERLSIQAETESIILEQAAVGEVWVAGGQSNMEFHMHYEKHREDEYAFCPNPRLRFFDVPEVCYDGQIEEFDYSRMGIWRTAVKEDLDYFSAAGYYFQKELERCLDVPIGIIGCNWGGTTASVWMEKDTLEKSGALWLRDYEERTSHMDIDGYWKKMHGNPINDHGDPFSNPLNQVVLPRTPDPEELAAFFQTDFAKGFQKQMEEIQGLLPESVPGCLFDHMVKTIAPFSIRGFLWYQGESDDLPGHQALYKDMLTGLIDDWRKLWQEKELPFLVVQLPGWERWMESENQDWAVIRRCQELAADTLEHVYLCSISDAGEQHDIHPKNKKVVGQRLALLARGCVYGEDILCEAPKIRKVTREKNRLAIAFDHAQGGLKIAGSRISALKVCRDQEEISFQAKAEGENLILILEDGLTDAVDVAFAQDKWYLVNLYNQADIPAVPFSVHCEKWNAGQEEEK